MSEYLTPYIITLDRNSPVVDLNVMKQHGVVGALIEIGFLYAPVTHEKKGTLHNPQLMKQINAVKDAGLDFGLFYYARARSSAEVHSEVSDMSSIIQLNYATLGIWLKPDSNVSDRLLDVYYDELGKLGVTSRIGLYCEKSYLSKINWNRHYFEWYLWLIDPVQNLSELDGILDPEFFNIEV